MDTCPNCGADLPPKAKVCPKCGSDETTGWSEEARYDGLDLPDEHFDYGEFVKRELAGKRPRMHWFWLLVAVGLTVVLLIYYL